jgi:hypothetical protein
MKNFVKILSICAMVFVMSGCISRPNQILLVTGTTIGFDVSEAPATSTPQATLAYKRVEIAIVPCPTNGIVPDVLMDFEFKTSIFTSGGGIHSRIATGQHATTQQAASLMMSRDKNGLYPTNLPTLLHQLN